ncbi:Gfo/Idh/MocA family protein [Oceanobacillus jeddahense]|uniref:Gfo/Idh/MocA family protein n=1 Tax=Oceanobacillus jeddahense TaxID=1462527 RepID=UPI000595E598|nr:Gfo/Idh/MocA family oxidoreductase [Oceanobacillus jeddahense]
MKKVSIGVVGAGIYGNYHLNIYTSDKNVENVVVCELNERRKQQAEDKYGIKGYSSVDSMLQNEQLDAVSIATSDPYHFDTAMDAMNHGIKYLFIEKPLATTLDESYQIVQLAEEKNVRICVDFHKRWDPAYNAIKKELKSGDANLIRGYMSLDDIIDVPTKWLNWADKSSPAWFLGVHCYDLIRYLTGSEVETVYATGNKGVLANQGIDTYDSMQAILTMTDGSNWTVENAWVLPNTFPKSNDGQLVIVTDNKYFKNESYRGLEQYTSEKASIPNYLFMNFDEEVPWGFGIEPIQDFVRNIIENTDFRANVYDGLQATKIANAIHESVITKKIIKLEK